MPTPTDGAPFREPIRETILTRRKTHFDDLDALRVSLGLFVREAASFLGISERTWYRWSKARYAPRWAYVALYALSGDLTPLGWRGWYIKGGELFCRDLNPRYYQFTPGHLLAAVFCRCPAHSEVNARRRQEEATPYLNALNHYEKHAPEIEWRDPSKTHQAVG